HYRHPGERSDRHVGTLGEREAMQQPIVKDIEVRSEFQVRFVNAAQTRGRAFRNKRGDPVRIRIAQCARATRMDVDRDRSTDKAKTRLIKWTGRSEEHTSE